jgi:hypothetical protein
MDKIVEYGKVFTVKVLNMNANKNKMVHIPREF